MTMLIGFNKRITALKRVRIRILRRHSRLVVKNKPTTLASRALLRKRLDQTLSNTLTSHLDKTKRCNLRNLMLCAVARKTLNKTAQNKIAVRWHNHVNVINHNHAAYIAKSQLSRNLLGSFQIAASHSLFQRLSATNKTTRIYVNRCHCLSSVNNNRTTCRKINLALHALSKLAVDLPLVEHVFTFMLCRIPVLNLASQIRSHHLQVFANAVVCTLAFHNHLLEVIVKNVSNNANRHIWLALQKLWTLSVQELFSLRFDSFPLFYKRFKVFFNRIFTSTICGGSNDYAHVFRRDFAYDCAKSAALTVG